MESKEPDIEFKIYNKLTRDTESNKNSGKWTLNLILCCLVVATGSFQFGYNISSLNSVTPILKDFIFNKTFLFNEYHVKSKLFIENEGYIKGNQTKLDTSQDEYDLAKSEYIEAFFSFDETWQKAVAKRKKDREDEIREKYNLTLEEFFTPENLAKLNKTIADKRAQLEAFRPKLEEGRRKVEKFTNILWTLTNCLFVIGGMTGTFAAKYLMDSLGRKSGIILHHMVSVVAGSLVMVSPLPMFESPICLMLSRFLFGIQGGMSCTLVPTYLAEISPAALRGRTGVIHQLCITIGILVAQVFGLNYILGSFHLWRFHLAMPMVPALIGSVSLLLFMPESPRALLTKNKDEASARIALSFLRNTLEVESELDDLLAEAKGSGDDDSGTVGMITLFRSRETRWPIITSLIIHITQQLSGINAVFFYSSGIFKDAGIPVEYIQYAILSTGVVNVIATIVCVPLIDSLGRKPLLIYPMVFMIIDFVCLILLLTFKGNNPILSYMSIVCIMLFVVSFAIGLGPIPFIYTAECFRQNARSSAMALSTLFNWTAGLVLTLLFPFMLELVQQYVFVIFACVIAFALSMIMSKVPETKGKTIEEIIARFNLFRTDI